MGANTMATCLHINGTSKHHGMDSYVGRSGETTKAKTSDNTCHARDLQLVSTRCTAIPNLPDTYIQSLSTSNFFLDKLCFDWPLEASESTTTLDRGPRAVTRETDRARNPSHAKRGDCRFQRAERPLVELRYLSLLKFGCLRMDDIHTSLCTCTRRVHWK